MEGRSHALDCVFFVFSEEAAEEAAEGQGAAPWSACGERSLLVCSDSGLAIRLRGAEAVSDSPY